MYMYIYIYLYIYISVGSYRYFPSSVSIACSVISGLTRIV